MTWVESSSRNFAARHEEDDDEDVRQLLELLEGARAQLAPAFTRVPGTSNVVVHASDIALGAAQPMVPVMRLLSAREARSMIVGWTERDTVHVLSPRVLEARAERNGDSRQLGLLAPAALYAQVLVGHNSELLPPAFTIRALRNALRWSWLHFGVAQYLGGLTPHMSSAVKRRLDAGPVPSFPPGRRDAALLGATLVEMIALELGDAAVVELVEGLPPTGPRGHLLTLFDGLALEEIEAGWRRHLQRLVAGNVAGSRHEH